MTNWVDCTESDFFVSWSNQIWRGKLNYVDLGPLPVSEEKEEQVVLEGMSTNSTRKQAVAGGRAVVALS